MSLIRDSDYSADNKFMDVTKREILRRKKALREKYADTDIEEFKKWVANGLLRLYSGM